MLDARKTLDQLMHRTVDVADLDLGEQFRKSGAVGRDIAGLAVGPKLVHQRAQRREIEWQPRSAGGKQEDRGRGLDRVTHAKLVKHVSIRGSEIGDREVAQDEPLKHRLVDDSAGLLLLRPPPGEAGRRYRLPAHA